LIAIAALSVLFVPMNAQSAGAASGDYLDIDGVQKPMPVIPTPIEPSEGEYMTGGQWYHITSGGTTSFADLFVAAGEDVSLVIEDGVTMTVAGGIKILAGGRLTI